MVKISKSSGKKTPTKIKKVKSTVKKALVSEEKQIVVEKKIKIPIKISKTYVPKDTEKYMSDKHLIFFKIKLTEWKKNQGKKNQGI